jgi:hypothetical protein
MGVRGNESKTSDGGIPREKVKGKRIAICSIWIKIS